MKSLEIVIIIVFTGVDKNMKKFLRFLRNLIFVVVVVFAVWDYQNNDSVRNATNNSLTALNDRISQMLSTGNLNPPKLGDSDPNTVKNAVKPETDDSNAQKRRWPSPNATVYVNIKNDLQLRSASIDAIKAWNKTQAFTFQETNNKKKAQVIISVTNDSSTNAAGETATSYNPVTGHLINAKVQLNKFYLQNGWYGYSYNRIVNTAEHELGHAIGLNHNKGVSVMYPQGSVYTIQPQDITNVKKLYNEK